MRNSVTVKFIIQKILYKLYYCKVEFHQKKLETYFGQLKNSVGVCYA
jgi:hypothetical protein